MKNKEKILQYLQENGEATIRELTVNLWVQTPQEYIRQLREEGHNIKTEPVKGEKHSIYKLIEPDLIVVNESGQLSF